MGRIAGGVWASGVRAQLGRGAVGQDANGPKVAGAVACAGGMLLGHAAVGDPWEGNIMQLTTASRGPEARAQRCAVSPTLCSIGPFCVLLQPACAGV